MLKSISFIWTKFQEDRPTKRQNHLPISIDDHSLGAEKKRNEGVKEIIKWFILLSVNHLLQFYLVLLRYYHLELINQNYLKKLVHDFISAPKQSLLMSGVSLSSEELLFHYLGSVSIPHITQTLQSQRRIQSGCAKGQEMNHHLSV